MRLALLYGGRSGEHEVSCRSAASILKNLNPGRYEVLPIAIDHEGIWYLQESIDPASAGESLAVDKSRPEVGVLPGRGLTAGGELLPVDVVFPILHGSFGEDGTVQGLLEMANLPYVGSGVLGSAAGMDKEAMKRLWKEAGLPTAPFVTFHQAAAGNGPAENTPAGLPDAGEQLLDRIAAGGLSPAEELFVKPARGGSSVGISRARGEEELRKALALAFRFDTKAIVEQKVVGREIECAVIGNDRQETFPPGEIIPRGGFYDYDAKYVDPDGARLVVPAELSEETLAEVREVAAQAYRCLEAEGYARVDLFVTAEGRILLNEINTIPGFTTISMFPRMCQVGGLSYPDLLERLIDLGIGRFRRREQLQYRYR